MTPPTPSPHDALLEAVREAAKNPDTPNGAKVAGGIQLGASGIITLLMLFGTHKLSEQDGKLDKIAAEQTHARDTASKTAAEVRVLSATTSAEMRAISVTSDANNRALQDRVSALEKQVGRLVEDRVR